jgi:ureidoacrylate peracid hydrolase
MPNSPHRIEIPTAALEGAAARRDGTIHPYAHLEPKRTALLVVDMQTAFLAPDSPFCIKTARLIVPAINRIAAALRAGGGQVVWIVSTYGPESEHDWPVLFEHIAPGERGAAFRAALSTGSPGHAVWPELAREAADPVVSKNRFSPFAGRESGIEALLRGRRIDTVLIAGTVTNVCCESTARDATMRNFKTVMVADANAARRDDEHNATLATFLQVFGDVLTTDEIVAVIAAAQAPARPGQAFAAPAKG